MRISDLFLAFPGLVFALAVAAVLGGGIQNAIIALAVISWPKFARLARGLTLTQKASPYLMAAKLSGSSTGKLLIKHILPNIAGPILVTAVLDSGTMMMELAGLSFLGLGVKPPMAEWGSMINDGRTTKNKKKKKKQKQKKYAADRTVDGAGSGSRDFYYSYAI